MQSTARPIYETQQNVRNEQDVAEWLSTKWGVSLTKLKRLYPVDYAAIDDGQITGFIEIKCRTSPSTQYSTYMISAEKIRWALETERCFGTATRIAVLWTDRLGVHRISARYDYALAMGGRTDRNDGQDIEPVCFIPIGLFKDI